MRLATQEHPQRLSPIDGTAVELGRDLRFRFAPRRFREPGPGEVRICVEWAGVCGSDLSVARTGRWIREWPAVLGHEIFGRIDAVGEGVATEIGTPVVADSRVRCGGCPACMSSAANCLDLAFVGESCPGGFATHCLLAETSVVPASFVDGAVAVLAEPLACALHAVGLLSRAPRRVAILGHGPLGALIHIALRDLEGSVEVAVAEPLEMRAQLADALGAERLGDDSSEPAFDAVFDVTGYPGSLRRAVELCASGGELIVVALAHGGEEINPGLLVEREIAVRGSHAFYDELPTAVAMLEAEPWHFRPLVTDAVELAQLPDFFVEELERPRGVKVVVRP
jgi:threonine dehydrogenase-like Zn-dependent dehydrogenase